MTAEKIITASCGDNFMKQIFDISIEKFDVTT